MDTVDLSEEAALSTRLSEWSLSDLIRSRSNLSFSRSSRSFSRSSRTLSRSCSRSFSRSVLTAALSAVDSLLLLSAVVDRSAEYRFSALSEALMSVDAVFEWPLSGCLSNETLLRRPDKGSTLMGTVVRGLAGFDAMDDRGARLSTMVLRLSLSICDSRSSRESRGLRVPDETALSLGLPVSGLRFWLCAELCAELCTVLACWRSLCVTAGAV